MNVTEEWSNELKRILEENGYSNCPECNRQIDYGDLAWNNACTDAGTGYSVVQAQCLACDTEIFHINSWYPEINDIEDLCTVLEIDLRPRNEHN